MTSSAIVTLDQLVSAASVKHVIALYDKLCETLALRPFCGQFEFFSKLKQKLFSKYLQKFNKISTILQKLEKRSQNRQYLSNAALSGQRVLVIGGGISGLRVAIELLFLGAQVLVVEKRDAFSRNNVIHLWPNVIQDMKALGAKRFYGQFCVGAIDHIAIRQLQLILLKIALLLGLEFRPNVQFVELCARAPISRCQPGLCQCCCHAHGVGEGASAHFSGRDAEALNARHFDVIVGSDGRRNTLFQDFPRKEFRGKLAIAITANFVNRRTESDVRALEISGVSYIYNQKWFRALHTDLGIQLENICYYSDETHYFVMTATKSSLLARGVLRRDCAETHLLLDDANICREQLLNYARDAAHWTSGLRDLEFALNGSQSPDVALFDFTSVYAAKNASRAKQVRTTCCSGEARSKHVLMMLTGDSLLEPFWPTGSGAGRGFLSALDAAYTALQWALKVVPNRGDAEREFAAMVEVLAERESVYRLLAQTTPENISLKDSLLPQNRYKKWTKNAINEIKINIQHLIGPQLPQTPPQTRSLAAKRARRATVAVTSRDVEDNDLEEIRKELEIQRIREKTTELTTHSTTELTTETSTTTEETTCRASTSIQSKADWLLGSSQTPAVANGRPAPSEAIAERALELESKMLLEKKPFSGKLEKVGKIEKNDFNFKPWNENTFFESKPRREAPPPPTLPNSRAILESRKNQMERKLEAKKAETRPEVKTKEWVEKMKEELTRRLGAREVAPLKCSSMPQCVRCGVDVSAVERISVCGHVLHRSCLRCSKCGISLRLNEFRNDLKFFCIFCLKNNSKIDSQIKAKEMFLKTNQKIDFRERIEFQNETQNEIEIINKTAVNEETTPDDEDDDQVLPFDNSSECDSTTSSDDDDSQEWETEDSEDDSEDDTDDGEDVSDDKRTTDTTTAIPSIRVTRETSDNKAFDDTNDDNNNDNCFRPEVRYLGSFTEKLFRSRSQPMIAFRNRLKIADKIADDDDMASLLTTLPFADDVFAAQHFSPVRAKAPIIDFEDI